MTTYGAASEVSDLLHLPLEELAAGAFAKARQARGYVVTYSPKVFIPLTKLCRDRCGYCTFAQAPARGLDRRGCAGELRIPFTAGLLVGIGESRQERLDTLEAIRRSHEEFG